MGRTFAMGDIHGAYRALLQCLERSQFDKQKDTLIHLGDVADGWSQVPQCVDELLTCNLVSIRGNHDEWCRRWFANGWNGEIWKQQGGKATIEAYVSQSDKMTSKDHRQFWQNQLLYYEHDNKLFIHGGYNWNKSPPEHGRPLVPTGRAR